MSAIPEDQIVSLEKRLARAEAALVAARYLFRESRMAHWTDRAVAGAIPCVQIAMLADQDLLEFEAHLAKAGKE